MYWLLVSEYSEQDTVKADNLKLGICYILYVLYGWYVYLLNYGELFIVQKWLIFRAGKEEKNIPNSAIFWRSSDIFKNVIS